MEENNSAEQTPQTEQQSASPQPQRKKHGKKWRELHPRSLLRAMGAQDGVSEDKVKLMINHSTAANSLREEDVSRVLEYDVFWRIPHDLSVSSSTQLGQPIVVAKPYARVSRSIIELAHALTGTRQEKRGFLDRVLGRTA